MKKKKSKFAIRLSLFISVIAIMVSGLFAYNALAMTSVTVTAPNGGEYWSGAQSITWTTSGALATDTVEIYYTVNNFTATTIIATATAATATGTYSWNTAAVSDSSSYNIKIRSTFTPNASDTANAVFVVDNTSPTLSTSTISSSNATSIWAKVGDNVTVAFVANENLRTPTVTIDGNAATTTVVSASTSWSSVYTMATGDTTGNATFSIAFIDLAGNSVTITTTTNSSAVAFDKTSPVVTFTQDMLPNAVSAQFDLKITVTESNASTVSHKYGFSSDSTCDGTDSYGTSYTSGTFFTLSDHQQNGKYICARSIDYAGNTTYQASAYSLNLYSTGAAGSYVVQETAAPVSAQTSTPATATPTPAPTTTVASTPAPTPVPDLTTVAGIHAEITRIMNLILQYQQEMTSLPSASAVITGIPSSFSFKNNLVLGAISDEVKYLQIALNSDSATKLASSGLGSPGQETTKFGALTKDAVIRFQEKYASDILSPLGLTKGTGVFGPATRAKLNSLLGM